MRKVLVFGITDNPGGIESVIMNYYRTFDKNKIQLDFLCNTEKVAYENEIKKLGGKIYRIVARSKNYRKYKQQMKDFFSKNSKEYDCIWVNVCSLANIDYLKYAKRFNIKKRIIHCHNSQNMDSFLRGILHRINRLIIRKYATDFWSCSTSASKWFYSNSIIMSSKYRLINNAINLKKYNFDEAKRQNYRKDLKIHDKIVLCNVGRLHFQKNQDFLIDVFKEFTEIQENSILLLVGEGEDRAKLERKIKKYELDHKIKMLGLQSDVSKILQGSDIFVMPSLFEGLSLSLIEAEASGLPVFVSDAISSESRMSEYYYELPLTKSAKEWANYIMNNYNKLPLREKRENYIKERGFDIEVEAKKVEEHLL